MTRRGDSRNITVMWDDGTAPMVIRNLTRSPITVFQKGFPAHKQAIGSSMQMHFAWSAIMGEDNEAVSVEGCNSDFTFSRRESFGKLTNFKTPKKIRSSITVEDGVSVMTFMDERSLETKILEGSSIDSFLDTTYMDLSVSIKGISVQM